MRAIIGVGHRSLAEVTEAGLRSLGCDYLKNGGGDVYEFELRSPCRCLVVVQSMTHEQVGFPLRARQKVESMVEIRRMVGGETDATHLAGFANSLVRALSETVPEKKWKGLEDLLSP